MLFGNRRQEVELNHPDVESLDSQLQVEVEMLDSSIINQVPVFKQRRASAIATRLEPSPRSHLVLESDVSIIQYDTRIFGSA